MTKNLRQFTKSLVRIIHGFVELFVHYFFKFVYSGSGQQMPPIKDLLLLESATSIAHKIRTKKITSVQVLESFIDRIKEVNPILNCVVADRFEEARKEARAIDELIRSGTVPEDALAKEKPFLGVPFTTKDCIAVKGMIHTSGLVKRRNNIAEEDADAIACLKAAGAYPIALTNVSELCMWWESANNLHGRSSNPYNTNHIVGGSSGGEGCLQGAAGSAFGIGSDIGGSIRMPSFFNGVFGHKPSKFIVSNNGQYPIPITTEQTSFLGIGPMSRHAEDLLPLLKIIAGKKAPELRLDEPVDIKKLKFYYQENDMGAVCVSPVSPEIKGLLGKISVHLEKAHGIKAKKVGFQRFRKSAPIWFANMKTPNGPTFQEQLANLQGSINPYLELLKWIFRTSEHTFIGIITALADKGGCKYGDEKHTYLVEERGKLRREIEELLGDDGVFLYPTHPTAAPFHNEPLVKPFNFSYTAIINVLGFPATHIPMGLNSEGLPIGIQVVANTKNDRLCLAVARELERAFGGWVPPVVEA
ncbi:fatty-acid amide hydrolase 2 [Asbolus verrucosus]|uniref:Fatty-acid amide hydrolase 2 n=1 Tax=Asbolus verrucosus TaxID=1661398 RepID=A0A482VJ25_ASBVE|nr:fatty-acid amide hydrolase 2 [Asbolus verrucosus]